MRYKNIIWDYNGTILDDTQIVLKILNTMLEKRDLPIKTMEEYREVFDFPIIEYYIAVGFDFSKYTFDELANEFMGMYDAMLPQCTLRQGAMEVINRLEDEGYHQSILTAGREKNVIQEIKSFGLSKYMKHITGLNNNKAESKVHLAKLHLEKIKAEPNEILFVGDTTHDKMVADAIGCDCLLMAGGHQSVRRLKEVNDKIALCAEDIKKFL